MTIDTKQKLKPGTVIRFHETSCEKLDGVREGDLAIVLEHPSRARLILLYEGKKILLVLRNMAFTGLTNTISIVSEE